MSFTLVKYLWETGVYSKDDLKTLVGQKIITADEYFEITRTHYYSSV